MSGGRLVVLDPSGRSVKQFPLASGAATLGSAHGCDIRVMLDTVCRHHATVIVQAAQTVIRNVGDGETFVNGRSVGEAALRHNDLITVGGRALRWEYAAPARRQQASLGVLSLPVRVSRGRGAGGARARGPRAVSGPPAGDRALRLAIEMNHRASMPASSGGKQVAIVQPQRRDTSQHIEQSPSPVRGARRAGGPASRLSAEREPPDQSGRKAAPRASPAPAPVPADTTKATLWIESRKTNPRRTVETSASTRGVRRSLPAVKRISLRHTVLKRQSGKRAQGKISAPAHIDPTKQAAIMLMTGHTPKSRISLNQSRKTPVIVVTSPSPGRQPAGRGSRRSGRDPEETAVGITPRRASSYSNDSSRKNPENQSVTVLEISESTGRGSSAASRWSRSPIKSPSLMSPKKSALKDLSKKSIRKTESIKFDLSNLENHQDDDETYVDSEQNVSEEDITLHYSDSTQSPSPRRSIHSRSSRMLEKLGTMVTLSPSRISSVSGASRKSLRGSMMVQKALSDSDYTQTDASANTTVASAFKTETLSPRQNLESYSIVDLVSLDSNDLSKSVYNSADSSNLTYGTPRNVSGRRTRSTINPTLLGSSTPYVAHVRATRSRSSPNISKPSTRSSTASRRSKSLTTPENKHISVNSTRISRASRSRSRINDSDLLLLDDTELEDSSPKTSRRTRTRSNAMDDSKLNTSMNSPRKEGMSTPENRHSPVEVGTPVLSIQSLLDSSQHSAPSPYSTKKGRKSLNYKRKTIGVLTEPRKRLQPKSKSLGTSARKTILRLSKDSSETSNRTDEGAPRPDSEDTVTPKSAVKLVPEAVKNKHSTAKKPQSKRSIIDDLNQSDIVKQLFNSPVKRKLSQSMAEFSRKQLFEDDDEIIAKRPTRNTIALGRIQDESISNESGAFTPERFVSPISTPSASPDLSGIKRLFQTTSPENDPRNVSGVKSSLRTRRTRRSANNDLTNVTGVKLVFGRSPRNRLSDVRVKEVFKTSPNNDLRRVTGVKKLFQRQTSPKNDLSDVRGVKRLFRKSPNNDLRNVSGVKRTLRKSPKDDLNDVRGVRKIFGHGRKKDDMHDVSGVEELFNTSNQSAHSAHSVPKSEILFDQLLGKPPVKAVYSKTFSTKLIQRPKRRQAKSLHSSLDVISNNVEEWLEKELQKRFHKDEPSTSKSVDRTRNASTKELHNLVTSTVEGEEPIRASRTRNSSMVKKSASEIYGAHTLPIKKRSFVESAMARPQLPIKKRAVVHSTPMKGRVDVTMNASELGRVSPIAAVDDTREVHRDTSTNRTTRTHNTVTVEKTQSTKASFEASQAKSPPKRVSMSTRKSTPNKNTKKRRASLVITKKAPVMGPKGSPRVSPKGSPRVSPKKTRTRAKKEQKIETPKTRVRAKKVTFVVAKTSPNLKPKPETKADSSQAETQVKPRRTRKTTAPLESQPRRARRNHTEPKGKEDKTDNVLVEKPNRGRKTKNILQENTQPEPTTRRGRKVTEKVILPTVPKTRRNNTEEVSIVPKTRGKKAEQKPTEPITRAKNVEEKPNNVQPKTRAKKVEEIPIDIQPRTRGKKVDEKSNEIQPKTVEVPVEIQPRTRGKRVETEFSTQSEPATRGRRDKVDDTVISGRKRKGVAIEEIPPKVSKVETRRGRRAVQEPEAMVKQTETKEVKSRGRSKKAEDRQVTPKVTRGKKVTEVKPKESPVVERRKRKTKAEAEPPKAKKPTAPAPRGARGAAAAEPRGARGAAAAEPRGARGAAVAAAPAGRSLRPRR